MVRRLVAGDCILRLRFKLGNHPPTYRKGYREAWSIVVGKASLVSLDTEAKAREWAAARGLTITKTERIQPKVYDYERSR